MKRMLSPIICYNGRISMVMDTETTTLQVRAVMGVQKLGAPLRLTEAVVPIPMGTNGPIPMMTGPYVFSVWGMAMLGHQIPTNGVIPMAIRMVIHIISKWTPILGCVPMKAGTHFQMMRHNGEIKMQMVLVIITHIPLTPVDIEAIRWGMPSQPIPCSSRIPMVMDGAICTRGLKI